MSQENAQGDAQQPGRKRSRPSTMYQRKRAVTACQACRTRKTKCDNIRPICGFCFRHGAQCIYSDTTTDHSSFDPASLAILERINHVVSLIETQQIPQFNVQHSGMAASESVLTPPNPMVPVPSPNMDIVADESVFDDVTLAETPCFPASSNSCEAILKWPIFKGSVPQVRSFVLESEDGPSTSQASLGRGIHEEDFTPLTRKFLARVHPKNPILELSQFSRYVRDASENGLRWDGPSCLVLIACALGSASVPFESVNAAGESFTGSSPTMTNKEVTLVYYAAAKKRLGLIEPSLLYVQCLFFCGVLEMYFLNALRAWNYFHQACVQFQNLSWRNEYSEAASRESNREMRRLEQRLYWSCLKSECELRCEIPLPSSGIHRFVVQAVLPSPPTELTSSPNVPEEPQLRDSSMVIDQDEETTWFYYLAEVSLRRMMTRAYSAFCSDGESGWIKNLSQNLKRHQAFSEQIDVWWSHIPSQISVDKVETWNSELAYLVNARATTFQEWIHRPFLYYAIHQPADDPAMVQALPLAKKCLELCVQAQRNVEPCHRHHGTWFFARTSVTRALLLLAAARSEKLRMPDEWEAAVQSSLQTIQFWADEAADLRKAADVLKDIVEETLN